MFDDRQLLELIEQALNDAPFCPGCHAPMTIEEGDDGRLWLVCSATVDPHGFMARVGAALFPHERRLVIDFSDYRAA